MGKKVFSDRIHALDNFRAILALLVVIFHAAFLLFLNIVHEKYKTGMDNQHFVVASVPRPYQIVFLSMFYIRIFLMPSFFLLAGFFAHFLCQHVGSVHLLKNRLMRIATPFLFFMFWLIPSYIGYVLLNMSKPGMTGDQLYGVLLARIQLDYHNGFLWHYLNNTRDVWFLYDLLWFYCFTFIWLSIRNILVRSPDQMQKIQAIFQKYFLTHRIYVIVPVLSMLLLLSRNEWYPPLDTSLIPSFSLLIFYSIWYVLGWWFWFYKEQLFCFSQKIFAKIIVSILLYLLYLKCYFYFIDRHVFVVYILITVLYTVIMTLTVLALFGTAWRYLAYHQPILRYLSQASYWIYLVQMPILLFLTPWLMLMLHTWYAQFTFAVVITLSLCLLSYQFFVRYSWLGRVIGKR